MANIFDISDIIIDYFQGEENDLTNLKLNKLLYFANGIYLARTGTPLFENVFHAWCHGPVVCEVYGKYKVFHRDPIVITENKDHKKLKDDESEAIIDALNDYGACSAWYLSRLTHKKGSPWYETSHKEVIDKNKIKAYFEKIKKPTLKERISELKAIGYIDKDGNTVLPADDDTFDDDWS